MTVGGISGKYPIYDQWSNEDGGRALEDQRRYGDRMSIQTHTEEDSRRINRLTDLAQRTQAAFEQRQKAFVERYGTDALASLANGKGGGTTLSPDTAKQLIADFAELEKSRVTASRIAEWLDSTKRGSVEKLRFIRDMAELSADGYDSRFLRDDEARLAAYNRAEATMLRLSADGARESQERAAREAGKIAEMASLKERLGPPSALYSVNAIGAIEIDFKALEKMGPSEAATSELARLIGVLAERNGLGQLRDGLIAIVNGQNRRLAERAP